MEAEEDEPRTSAIGPDFEDRIRDLYEADLVTNGGDIDIIDSEIEIPDVEEHCPDSTHEAW
jgi:hypothetical protein